MDTLRVVRFVGKPLVFLAALLPLLLVVGDAFEITGRLTANPIEDIQDRFGNWGLRFTLIALTVIAVALLMTYGLLEFTRSKLLVLINPGC